VKVPPLPPALTVIIPCLNEEAWIAGQLEALLRQQWPKPWELIVSDNGSTDRTLDVVRRYEGRLPLRIVDAPDVRGPAHARNVAARAALAPAIAFCDADDEVGEGWLAAVGDALERHELVACRGDGTALNPPWLRATRDTGDELPRIPFPPFVQICGAGGLGVHASVHETLGGFDETLPVMEDNDYCIRAQQAGVQLVYVPEAIIHYRYRQRQGEIFRQARLYARERANLQKRYAPEWRPFPWKWPLRRWKPIVTALATVGTRAGRARFLWLLGWQIGRFQGSLRYRVLAV
jgi:glycosyltransferase involved in cell wall biosynthesis